MSAKQEHSPLPWRVFDEETADISDPCGNHVARCTWVEDAQLIVEAVGMLGRHTAWVSQLRDIVFSMMPIVGWYRDNLRRRARGAGPQAVGNMRADELNRLLARTRKLMKEIGNP